jgi:hypothetical protein
MQILSTQTGFYHMIMKKRYLTLSLFVFSIALVSSTWKAQTENLFPISNTNAPGETSCGESGCHTGNINGGPGGIQLTMGATYVPGVTYNLQLTVVDPGKSKFGFSTTVLDGTNMPAGTLTKVDGVNTEKQTGMVGGVTREYIGHKNASGKSFWSLQWTAPATDAGPVTFYISGTAANNNGSAMGDNVYTRAITVNRGWSASLSDDLNPDLLEILPNPVSDFLKVRLQEGTNPGHVSFRLFDASGREVLFETAFGTSASIDISDLPAGIYWLHVKTDEGQAVKKVLKQ